MSPFKTNNTPEGRTPILHPVMVTGGQPSIVDELGYDPLHPSWATEIHVGRGGDDFSDPRELAEHAGFAGDGTPLVKLKGISKPMAFGDLRNTLDQLEASQTGVSHLRADERTGDDATKAFNAGLIDEKPEAPDESATRADPDEVAKQAATRAKAAEATAPATTRASTKR